jgi:hypothetical protein
MEAWLGAHGLAPVARPVWPADAAPPEPAPTADVLSARRKTSAEALRKQLRDLADTLGARDLEKVTAFAEFVKARRAARGFAHRQDGGAATGDPDGELPSQPSAEAALPVVETKPAADDDEEATPSSRKRPAAR